MAILGIRKLPNWRRTTVHHRTVYVPQSKSLRRRRQVKSPAPLVGHSLYVPLRAFSGHSPFVVCDCRLLRTAADVCGLHVPPLVTERVSAKEPLICADCLRMLLPCGINRTMQGNNMA